jgi:hypothetical protein
MKMMRTRRFLSLFFCAFYAVGAGLVISRCLHAGEAPADEKNKEDEEKKRKEKEERDKKEPPFKCSAWCAFKDLSIQPIPPKNDPTAPPTDQTNNLATQWQGFGRRGQWASIVVELENLTKDVTYRGSVAVNLNAVNENQAGQIPYKTNYRKEFELAPGGGIDNPNRQQIRFSVLCKEDWNEASETLTLEVSAGSQSKTRLINLTNLDAIGEDFIVVVAENEGSFRYLNNKKGKNYEDADAEPDSKNKERQVAAVRPADFPTRWHDLTLANMIIVEGPPNEKLTDAQFEALKSYVQAGGHLLLMAGEDPSRLKGQWEELAGITVKGTTNIQSIDEIHPSYKDPNKNWAMTIIDVQVKEDARRNSLVKRNKNGCVEMCRRFYGAGSVTFLPFSLNNPALKTWDGRSIVPAQIIERGAVSTLFGQAKAEDIENARNKPTRSWLGYTQTPQVDRQELVNLRATLDSSFSNDTPVQNQKSSTVLSFILFYLLCAVPGNYFLFGWFRRREVAWLAVPIWAASFSAVAYAVGYMGQTGKLTVNELSVVEAGPREDVGIARTFFGIYAPLRDDYQVEFPNFKRAGIEPFDVQAAPGHLVNVTAENTHVDLPALSIVDTDTGLNIERMLIQQRSTRRLEIVHRVKLGNGLDVKVKPNAADEQAFDIEIENNTGYELRNPVFVHDGKAIELGPMPRPDALSANASNQLLGVGSPNGPQWRTKDEAFFGKPVYFLSVRGKQAGARTNALKEFLRERVDHFSNGVVCAWIEERPLPATLFNSRHKEMEIGNFDGLTLLLVPVAVTHGGKTASQVLKGGPLAVQYALNYVQNSNARAKWLSTQKAVIPMQLEQFNNGQTTGANAYAVSLQFQSPANAALLNNDGCYMRMHFKLAMAAAEAGDTDPVVNTVSGDLTVFAETRTDNGSFEWKPIAETTITDLKANKPFRAEAIDIPLGNYKMIHDNTMHLLLKAETTSQNPIPLEVRDLIIKVVEE